MRNKTETNNKAEAGFETEIKRKTEADTEVTPQTEASTEAKEKVKSNRRTGARVLRYAVLAAAAAAIFAGVQTGEAETVFNKAAYICLECIGIG